MEASLKDYYFLNMENGRFEKVPEFPKKAWLEGIVNAICHQSYNLQGNCIYIKHFKFGEGKNEALLPFYLTKLIEVSIKNLLHPLDIFSYYLVRDPEGLHTNIRLRIRSSWSHSNDLSQRINPMHEQLRIFSGYFTPPQ